MSDQQNKQLIEEENKIIQSRTKFIERYYPIIRDAYNKPYDWPDVDPLRGEICLCIMFGLFQAAITLTNHFLESLLKYALIYKHGKNKKQKKEEIEGRATTAFIEKHEEGLKLYGNANLCKTINRACTVGLITKDQKNQLHQFRERLRNAYSHSDKKKIFGDKKIPIQSARLEKGKIVEDEKSEPKIADFPIVQGLIQEIKAQNDAPEYFLYIDKLAREIKEKLFDKIKNIVQEK